MTSTNYYSVNIQCMAYTCIGISVSCGGPICTRVLNFCSFEKCPCFFVIDAETGRKAMRKN